MRFLLPPCMPPPEQAYQSVMAEDFNVTDRGPAQSTCRSSAAGGVILFGLLAALAAAGFWRTETELAALKDQVAVIRIDRSREKADERRRVREAALAKESAEREASALRDRVQKSFVFVVRMKGAETIYLGTGAFVGPSGAILTADHVAGTGAGLIGFYQDDGKWTTGPLEAVERIPEDDLAVLKAPAASVPRTGYLAPAADPFEPGKEYAVWAAILQRSDLPQFEALPFRAWCFGGDRHALFLQLVLLPGCSGSPILNAAGEFGGVYVSARSVTDQAVPVRVAEGSPTTEAAATTQSATLTVQYSRAAKLGRERLAGLKQPATAPVQTPPAPPAGDGLR